MQVDEKHYDEKSGAALGTPYDEKSGVALGTPYDEKDVAVVSAVGFEDDDLETTHIGEHGIRRDLPPRVVSMIAIAGTIGTGLFLGSGTALTMGGPVGMWLGYTLVGMGVGCMMQSLGEMVCYRPNVGSFIEFGTKFVDPALGFMMGVNLTLQVGFGVPTELAAIATLFSFWDPNKNHAAAYIAGFLVLTVIVNIIGVKWYGEIEFFFACVKVATLVGLMIFGLIADLGGIPTNREFIGGRYWRNEPFNDNFMNIRPVPLSRFAGFWAVFTKAAFSFSAIESVALIAGEAHNPRRTMKMAIRTVFYRIVGIYVLSTLIIGLTVSQYSPLLLTSMKDGAGTAGASPFVVLCKQMNVRVLPHIINGVVVTSALSSGNEQMYALSRGLMGMARNGQMPKIFLKTSKQGIPYAGVLLSGLCGFLAFLCVSEGSNVGFVWLSNLSALSGLTTWICICISYIRFQKAMKVQGIDRKNLVFRGFLQPYLSYFAIFFFLIILIFNGYAAWIPKFNVSTFFASYITLLVILLAFVTWKLVKKTRLVPLEEIDLSGGPKEAMMGTRYDPTYSGSNYVYA